MDQNPSLDRLTVLLASLKKELSETNDPARRRELLSRMSRVLEETDVLIQDYLAEHPDKK